MDNGAYLRRLLRGIDFFFNLNNPNMENKKSQSSGKRETVEQNGVKFETRG